MKKRKDKSENIVFGEDESVETMFEKIKGWEITSQVEFAVSFDNQKRKELFEKIFETVTNETVKHNISLIVQRIEQAAFQVSGYTPSETEYYQSLFAKHFYSVLHSENYQTYIEDKIRELHFYSKGLEQDLRTKHYEFLEDREQNKNQLTEAERYKVYLEKLLIHLDNPKIRQTETKTDKLKAELGKYGFFELSKVKQLTEPNVQCLIEHISSNGLPYSIAMFDFLGFLKHIEKEHFATKSELNIEVAKWFNSDKEGRAVKGNISSLSDYTTENKSRYTAHTHKEKVITDYQKLK